jgi:hypothetical protein
MADITGDFDSSMPRITGDIDTPATANTSHNIRSQAMADFTSNIERMVEIEATLGVRLNALSAMTDEDGDLAVMGEVHFNEPPEDGHSHQVHLLVYDAQGRVVGKEYCYVGSEGIPFDSFDMTVYDLPTSISKIRVYVKKD